EQPMDRKPGHLAGDVPEGDVHGPDGAEGRVADPVGQGLVEALAVERVLAHHHGLQVLDQRGGVELGAAHGRTEEGVALHAVVGAHGEEAELARATEATGVATVGGGGDAGPCEEGERDVGDLHARYDAAFRRQSPPRGGSPWATASTTSI